MVLMISLQTDKLTSTCLEIKKILKSQSWLTANEKNSDH